MDKLFLSTVALSCCFLLTACAPSSDHADLKTYMQKVKRKPRTELDALPSFRPYKAFTYSATPLRAPFDIPVKVTKIPQAKSSNVKPDLTRQKEFLEEFPIGQLSMVGTLERDEILWILVDTGNGGIHRVRKGSFMGKNHGKIVAVAEDQIDIVEIVTNGTDGWIERPRTLKLRNSGE